MESNEREAETPDLFLSALGRKLKTGDGVDSELVDILAVHILTASPGPNAVAQAKDAIVKLATTRAKPARPEDTHG